MLSGDKLDRSLFISQPANEKSLSDEALDVGIIWYFNAIFDKIG